MTYFDMNEEQQKKRISEYLQQTFGFPLPDEVVIVGPDPSGTLIFSFTRGEKEYRYSVSQQNVVQNLIRNG